MNLSPGQIAAICYADVFDYPLTKGELKKYEINVAATLAVANKKLAGQGPVATKDQNYCYLEGRENVVHLRKKREQWAKEKFRAAQSVVSFLQKIPTIQLIAVTGALAMNNTDKHDDIDLLVVSSPHSVWTTRFLSIAMVELLGKRRRPRDHSFGDKICLNMFLDTDHLMVPKREQDLFSAHEVAQVRVLFDRGTIENKFHHENSWITQYLPKFKGQSSKVKEIQKKKSSKILWILEFVLWTFERFAEFVQMRYMDSKRTSEVVSEGYLRFHPNDAREWILPAYQKRLRKCGLG